MKNQQDYICGADFIKLSSVQDARLLSNEKSLKQIIKVVNIMEVPDIEHWVHPGELLITTGYPFRNDLNKMVRLITILAEKKVAGIAIKPKRFINQIPDQVIKIADQNGLMLVELGPSTVFADIVFEAHQCAFSKRMDTFQKTQRQLDYILSGISQNTKLKKILEMIEEQLGFQMIIMDDLNEIVATRKFQKQWKFFHYDDCEQIRKQAKDKQILYLDIKNEKVKSFFYFIKTDTEKDILFIALEDHKKIVDSDSIILSNIAQIMALQIKNETAMKKLKIRYRNRFILDWVTGVIKNPTDIFLFAKSHDYFIDPDKTYCVAVANLPLEEEGQLNEYEQKHISYIIEQLDMNFFLTFSESNLILVLESDDPKLLFPSMSQLNRQLKSMMEHEISICLSNPKPINEVSDAYMEAMNINMIRNKCNMKKQIMTFKDLGVFSILSLLPEHEEITKYTDYYLDPLKEYDRNHNSQLLETLKVYIASSMNSRTTARIMFTHYNTIAYRLQKIKKVLQMDIDDMEIILQLQLALKLQLMKSEE